MRGEQRAANASASDPRSLKNSPGMSAADNTGRRSQVAKAVDKKPDWRFSRHVRLTRAGEFERALRNPEFRIRRGSLRLDAVTNTMQTARLGLVVAKRAVAKAHDRNRIKRIVRNRFRNARPRFASLDLVIRVVAPVDRAQLHATLDSLFAELEERSGDSSKDSSKNT